MGKSQSKYSSREGWEIKNKVEFHAALFVQNHCQVHPCFFVPIRLLKLAWGEYCKKNGIAAMVDEYWMTYSKDLGGIVFHEAAICDEQYGMYYGIAIVKWPE
jgi:hypothetical protein